jgi:regulatory protein
MMRTPRRLEAAQLWEYGVRILAGRACSIGELRQKLTARAAVPADVEPALARFKEYGYLDDRRFADQFAAARLDNQRLGQSRVVQDLRRRRVAPALAQAAVQKAYAGVDEMALVEEFIRKKYRTEPHEGLFRNAKDLASAYRRLLHAGFAPGTAIRALKRFAANPELLDNFEPPSVEDANE